MQYKFISILVLIFSFSQISLTNGMEINGHTKILVIGDSLAQPCGHSIDKILLTRFESAGGLDRNFKDIAVVGTTIEQWASGPLNTKLKRTLKSFNPDVIFISLGTNDANANLTTAQIEISATALLKQLGNRTIVWIGPPNSIKIPKIQVTNVTNGINEEIPCPPHAFLFNTQHLLSDLPIGKDGIHPTKEGFEQLGNAVFDFFLLSAEK